MNDRLRSVIAMGLFVVLAGYVGFSATILREASMQDTELLFYFLLTGTAVLVLLVFLARRFGRED